MNVNHSAKTGDMVGIVFSSFFNMKVCCMFSLESPHHAIMLIIHTTCHYQYKRKTNELTCIPNTIMSAAIRFFFWRGGGGLKIFDIAVVNEPSVFELSKFHCS